MPFFKKSDKTLIPPISTPLTSSRSSESLPSYRSKSSALESDPYSTGRRQPPPSMSGSDNIYDKYRRNRDIGDVYARGKADLNQDRNELFAGYDRNKAKSSNFLDGSNGSQADGREDREEEDIEGIKQQTRFVKQESVNTTRNAIRLAREAEESARNTLSRLGDQSEKLANTEMHLDIAKGYSRRASDKTNELKKLNRSIFRPSITFNKAAKQATAKDRIQARYEEERNAREQAMLDIRNTKNKLGGTMVGDGDELVGRGGRVNDSEKEKLEQRSRYQFEATASDDEFENELDENLDEIGRLAGVLKLCSVAMGDELVNQNNRLDRITGKADELTSHIEHNTDKLRKI